MSRGAAVAHARGTSSVRRARLILLVPDQSKAMTERSPGDKVRERVMKRLTAVASVGTVVIFAAFAATAKPGASIERSLKMVTDAVIHDVRTAAAKQQKSD